MAPALVTATASTAGATNQAFISSLPTGSHSVNSGPITPRPAGNGHVVHGITGIDSIPNFSDHFNVKGISYTGAIQNSWQTNFVGNTPQHGGTTNINAPIIPVNVNLEYPDGSSAVYLDATQFVSGFVNGPDFSNHQWSSSSTPTQLGDAIDRAQFHATAKADWHTLLNAQPTNSLTMNVPYGEWEAGVNVGACGGCDFALVDYNTFGNLFGDIVNQAINAGYDTTKDIATYAFPNTYLFDPSFGCCVLGYHTYFFNDLSNGTEQRYVLNYSSWISPGLFGGGFQDVTANSHELAETFADPFVVSDGVHGLTPFWNSAGECQDVMEVGDVIEVLNNATYPVTMNSFTYHPQNEALMQWFNSDGNSNALDGAYSYPDETVLTSPTAPQPYNCGQ
jgi:hypothetical protein